MMKPFFSTFAVFTALWLFATPARAQYTNIYTGNTFNNGASAVMDSYIQNRVQRTPIYRSVLRKKGWYSDDEVERILQKNDEEILAYMKEKKKVTDGPSAPDKPAAASRFQRNANRYLIIPTAEALGKTDEEKANYRTIFAEVIKVYEGEADRLGFTNDVAGAMAFFTEVNYALYHPGKPENSDAGTKALVRQLQASLESESLRKASDEDKQKLYEQYLVLTGYTLAIAAASQGHEKMKDELVKLGGEGLRYVFKVDPARVKLNDKGVEIAPEK